uniref:Ribonuclease VapC n=1 Tax=Candidatus Kentrum sp. FM TaxID=2126340 RepID=A0A450TMZ1_9GAMM|nr:MAG: tRNA(fMet)-specific endonuclease VapC [Candidatus Kentron sp. FM]VFJ69856.1 MAG: tRNA(fMet)-specific endonuclease VapC [Candidatus Kentron sp. FM]VFK17786.1 MAG: tRNA(fMet)-specific endonuclease VapC [Candidatus Kentron sp. FM]
MRYLIDTNVCIAYLRGKNSGNITARLVMAGPGEVALCSVVKAELLYGAEHSANPDGNRARLQRFFASIPTSLPFDDAAADAYGGIRAQLEARGTPIGPNDLMIAAIGLSRGLMLVTHNTSEFRRVPGLRIEDWQTA